MAFCRFQVIITILRKRILYSQSWGSHYFQVSHHSSVNSIPGFQISGRTFLFNKKSKVLNPPPVSSCEIPLAPVEQFLPLNGGNAIRIRHLLSEHSQPLLYLVLSVPSGPAWASPTAVQLQQALQKHVALPSHCFSPIFSLFNGIIFPRLLFQ